MIEVALSLLGLGRKFPLITGLLLYSAVGMTYNFFENRSIASNAVEKAQGEAIIKDAKENRDILSKALKDQAEHQTEITKSNERLKTDVKDIAALTDTCLDVALPERLQRP